MIRIIIADDHAFFRSGLAMVIRDNPSYLLVDEAADGQDLIEKTEMHQPDIVILDIEMPFLDGIKATTLILKNNPLIKIIAMTAYDQEILIFNMMKAGASSFLDKNITKDEVYRTIDAVYNCDDFYFPPKLRQRAFHLHEDLTQYASGKLKKDFSDREMDIIWLTCQDLSLKEIADNLDISPRTVETHRARIMDKMNVRSAAGMVAYAFTHKLFMQSN